MTFLELKTLVSMWVDDLQFGYFTQAQVGQFLNNAQREIQKSLVLAGENYYVGCPVTTSTVIGQSDYVLPDDFLKIHRIEISLNTTDVTVLEPITLNQQDFLNRENSTPECYYIRKNRLILVPPPSQVQTLRMWYSYRVADMVDDAELPDVPEEFQETIAVLATYDCFLKDGRPPEMVLKKKQDYEEKLKQMAVQRQVARPRKVVVTSYDSTWNY